MVIIQVRETVLLRISLCDHYSLWTVLLLFECEMFEHLLFLSYFPLRYSLYRGTHKTHILVYNNTSTHSAPDLSIKHRAQPISERTNKEQPCAFQTRADVWQANQDLLLVKQRLCFCNFRRFERSSQCLESIVVTGNANRILDIQWVGVLAVSCEMLL